MVTQGGSAPRSDVLDLTSIFLRIRCVASFRAKASPFARDGLQATDGTGSMPTRRWRSRRIGTAGLGLFALLLQLFLSFGHLHVRGPLAPTLAGPVVGKSTVLGQEKIPSGLPDDDCPICAAMHVAASGLLPAPPSVAAPADFAQVSHQAFIEEFNLGVRRHTLFQTRAPPIA
jgi:hypothetical protein